MDRNRTPRAVTDTAGSDHGSGADRTGTKLAAGRNGGAVGGKRSPVGWAIRWVARCGGLVVGLGVSMTVSAAETNAVPIQRPRAMTQPVIAEPAAVEVAAPVEVAPVEVAPAVVAPASAAAPTTSTSTSTSTVPSPRATSVGATGVRKTAAPPSKAKKQKHEGFTVDMRLGTLGCVRGLCSGEHNVRPGFRVDGFIGGNIKGFVDVGFAGGWGALSSDVAPGTNALTLYGLDPYALQQALTLINGGQSPGIDLTALSVTDSKLRTAQAGPMLRVHFIPRGRFIAYVGSGVQYNLFRARYGTAAGGAKIDFHGLAVPIEAAFGVHVHEHVALGVQFDYLWTWYAISNVDHGGQALTVPVRILDEAARMQNTSLRSQLPQFWTFGLMLRARI